MIPFLPLLWSRTLVPSPFFLFQASARNTDCYSPFFPLAFSVVFFSPAINHGIELLIPLPVVSVPEVFQIPCCNVLLAVPCVFQLFICLPMSGFPPAASSLVYRSRFLYFSVSPSCKPVPPLYFSLSLSIRGVALFYAVFFWCLVFSPMSSPFKTS